VSVAIQKIEGVESVEVSLNEGTAEVTLKPGNHVDPERIRQVTRDNGFTPKGAFVRVAGRLIEREGKPALAVTGLDLVYGLTELPEARGRLAALEKVVMGKEVLVIGRLPESEARQANEPRVLEVRELVAEGH